MSGKISFSMSNGQRVKFWKISGVEMSHFVFPSPPYLPLLSLRMRGWQICGTQQLMGVNGFLASLGHLMIGRWKMWGSFDCFFKQKGCLGMRKIG